MKSPLFTSALLAVFVHFGTGQTQELLVRMQNPDMPTAPAGIGEALKETRQTPSHAQLET